MAQKLTPWFPSEIKPVRRGVYIASTRRNRFYRYWNGRWWSYGSYELVEVQQNVAGDMRRKFGKQRHQDAIRWRGLAEQPK